MDEYEPEYAVLSRGLGGCHADTIDGASVTIYDSRLQAYLGNVVEGGYVIDNRAVLDRNPGLVLRSPMCEAKLLPGSINRFRDACPAPERSIVAAAIASNPENGYCGLARLMLACPDAFEGFNFVAPDVYAGWWLQNGARVGERHGKYVLWSDGKEELILAAERRYVDAKY
jgi:hypothetical protein